MLADAAAANDRHLADVGADVDHGIARPAILFEQRQVVKPALRIDPEIGRDIGRVEPQRVSVELNGEQPRQPGALQHARRHQPQRARMIAKHADPMCELHEDAMRISALRRPASRRLKPLPLQGANGREDATERLDDEKGHCQ